MKIRTGRTRIVFLVGDLAVKIAKPRFIRLIIRLILFPFVTQESRNGYYKTYGKNPFRSCKRYIFFTIRANLNEYKYSKKYNDPDIMPVIKRYFFGLIITQKRGENLKNKNFKNPLLKLNIGLISPESTDMNQYCLFKGKTLLVDYGDISTIKDLLKTQYLRAIHNTIT